MAESSTLSETPKLSDIFDEIYSYYRQIESSEESSNSESVQVRVRNGIEKCELAIRLVNALNLFTSNESLEEVATSELRYMTLPALSGYFTLRCGRGERSDIVKKAKVYFADYLRLCKLYKVTDIETPGSDEEDGDDDGAGGGEKPHKSESSRPSNQALDHAAALRARQAKIERFKQKKANDQKLRELYTYVCREHVDDEVKREYYTKQLDQWIIIAVEELEGVENELQILEHMAKHHGKDSVRPKPRAKARPLRPFIITKDAMQKKVFGLGYPAIPTVTVEEYYREQVARGVFPDAHAPPPSIVTQEEREEQLRSDSVVKELLIDRDDEATLRQAREWDDWKDDHRTGWGNTKNMG